MLKKKRPWALTVVAGMVCAWASTCVPALAWGPDGHKVVAAIAEANLTPAARAKVDKILGPYNSLTAVSVWADDARDEHPETAPWHYIDIPLNATSIDIERDCRDGNCVIAKIKEYDAVLKDPSADPDLRRTALKFVVHFVADLHQPLHCEDDHDKGGNDKLVTFFGSRANLHSVWDSGIISRMNIRRSDLAHELAGRITATEKRDWTQGSVEDWALESHRLAQTVAYGRLPHEAMPNLGDSYFNESLPVVQEQLQKAGIRLAWMLNQALQ